MADYKEQKSSPHPLAPTNAYARSDEEAAAAAINDERDLRRKKCQKCLLYIVLFAIFQTGIILIFALIVMKIRTPKFRVRSAALDSFVAGAATTARMKAELGVKNANFGRFKYQNATVYFYYRGEQVGQAVVGGSKASWRSTKKIEVAVDLRLGNGEGESELASDLRRGAVAISSQAEMKGKVELMFVMKKNKSTNMNCSMEIVTEPQQVQNIVCK